MVKPATCLYCAAPADPTVPALVPYCAACWADEPDGVKARLARDANLVPTVEAAVALLLSNAVEVRYE